MEEQSLEKQLNYAIQESLQNHLYENASFLCERLLAEQDSEENKILLADCYLAEGKYYKVYYILKNCKSEMARYKFAIACLKLKKYKDGEKALQKNQNQQTPNGAFGQYLLAQFCQHQKKHFEAKELYAKSLELNPNLWVSYENSCKLGDQLLPNKVFIEENFKKNQQQNQIKIQNSKHINFTNILEEKKKQKKKISLCQLLKSFAEPYYDLSQYQCQEAIEGFKKLSQSQLNTGWVLSNIGRCYFEMVKYDQAEKYFQQAWQVEPYRHEGLEYYSSTLWQLKKKVEITNLAYNVLDKSITQPESWIVVGNCFSMQKEHENALKFFNRAIQLDPNNSYAYTLCGHEYAYNDDFIKAKKCFDTALNLDIRSYSAWWGIGNLSYRQESYVKAAEHFQKAISINPRCPILHSYLGMTYASNRDYQCKIFNFQEALKHFENSENLDSTNVLNKYQKADVLVKLEQFDLALIELEKLRSLMPREAPIPTLIGKIYKKKNIIEKAHYYFTLALDLESKDSQKVKQYIESLHSNQINDYNDDLEF